MEHDSRAYCWDFNSDGYCKTCGKRRSDELPKPNGKWPRDTWMQQRRAYILRRQAEELDQTDWR